MSAERLAALLREARYNAAARGQFDSDDDLATWLVSRGVTVVHWGEGMPPSSLGIGDPSIKLARGVPEDRTEPELIVTPEIRARLAIREAIHRTALAAARLTPHRVPRRYLTQDNKDAILESVLEDFPGVRAGSEETP